VHKKTVSVCVLTPGTQAKPHQQVREFGTTTRELLGLADWLLQHQVTHIGMESTGVYWKPIWNILEAAGFTLTLAHAQHVKNVPGKKTDTADCVWLAQRLRYGLLPASFVPAASLRELRDLTRARTTFVRERAAVANRIQKTLEDANIKLGNVVSDILGVSSRAMLSASSREKPRRLASRLSRGRMQSKQPELISALEGKISDHHRFLLREYLDQVEYLERKIVLFEEEIGRPWTRLWSPLTYWTQCPAVTRCLSAAYWRRSGPTWRSSRRHSSCAVGPMSVRVIKRVQADGKVGAPGKAIAGCADC
jgi:transposase